MNKHIYDEGQGIHEVGQTAITAYIEGITEEELEEIADEFAGVLARHGFGNNDEESEVRSIIVVRPWEEGFPSQGEDLDMWLAQMTLGAGLLVIPTS